MPCPRSTLTGTTTSAPELYVVECAQDHIVELCAATDIIRRPNHGVVPHFLAAGPRVEGAVAGTCDEVRVVEGKGAGHDVVRVAFELAQRLAARQLPHPHVRVLPDGDQLAHVMRHAGSVDHDLVLVQNQAARTVDSRLVLPYQLRSLLELFCPTQRGIPRRACAVRQIRSNRERPARVLEEH
eukprot:3525569-Rhodomonas_salina.3